MKARKDTARSVRVKWSVKGGAKWAFRGVCEGVKNRGLVPLGEAPDSMRGLTRVQYPSRVNRTGYGRWLKACTGMGG